MAKRSKFERKDRDYYPTPLKAVLPLIPHLKEGFFAEPCAGDGRLIRHIESLSKMRCMSRTDIEPQAEDITKEDALKMNRLLKYDNIITNPPWDRKILHKMIEVFIESAKNVWLLFDSDWIHTKQSIPYMEYCRKIVSVGRVKWIEESKSVGKDNASWHMFSKKGKGTQFFGRIG